MSYLIIGCWSPDSNIAHYNKNPFVLAYNILVLLPTASRFVQATKGQGPGRGVQHGLTILGDVISVILLVAGSFFGAFTVGSLEYRESICEGLKGCYQPPPHPATGSVFTVFVVNCVAAAISLFLVVTSSVLACEAKRSVLPLSSSDRLGRARVSSLTEPSASVRGIVGSVALQATAGGSKGQQ
ncbi:hypothetical protein VTJ83DRAFT_80 [Remersonia thermophila]|uniref:CASP-like protein n=1 Tax=Remersonia thermophila TaxID=72144 RepID=A0ABR4DL05_9PEZI